MGPVFPWLLAWLGLIPLYLLPGSWAWAAFPVMFALLAFGYWLIWPRYP